jgi:hypothetical protein
MGITHNTPRMAWGIRSDSRQEAGFKVEAG